jgi:hypothetical protein
MGKHKGLDPYEAKRLYVEALLKVRTTSVTFSVLIYTLFQGVATIFRQNYGKASGRRGRLEYEATISLGIAAAVPFGCE